MKITIGVQCFSVRHQLNSDEKGTIEQLKKIGFKAYEPLILPMNAPHPFPPVIWTLDNLAEKAALVHAAGFATPSAHIVGDLENFCIPAPEMAAALRKIHEMVGIKFFVFSIAFHTAEAAKAEGEYLHTIQSLVKQDGLQVLYHNHDMEFKMVRVDGEELTALDYFLRFAGEDILLELDIGWAGYASDDVKTAEKYADRIAVLHLKDFTAQALHCGSNREQLTDEAFTPIGFGAVRTAEIMKMAQTMPHYASLAIIDQDQSATPILEELAQGFHYVQNLD